MRPPSRWRPAPLLPALLITVALATVACTATPTAPPGSSTPSGTAAGSGTPHPMASALSVQGPAVVDPAVVRVAPERVRAVSPDGARFTLSGTDGLTSGSVFLVPGVAARKITAVHGTGDALVVDTVQATLGETFGDLDVRFGGVPDDARLLIGGDPAPAAGTSVGSFEDAPGLRRPGALRAACPSSPGTPIPKVDGPGVAAGPYTFSPSLGYDAGCRTTTFSVGVGRTDAKVDLTGTLAGSLTVNSVRGALSTRPGAGSSVTADIDAAMTFKVQAKAKAKGGAVDRGKVTWDMVKLDVPVVVAGVPVVVRLGIPFIVEVRFSGGADLLSATLFTMKCKGTVTVSPDSGTPKSICTMAPADINQFMSIAPTAFVFSAGLKVGLGLGVVAGKSAVAFAGMTGTLAGSIGATYSGGAGIPVTECTRVDRTVQFTIGGELSVLGMSLSTSAELWKKTDTYQEGQRCRPS